MGCRTNLVIMSDFGEEKPDVEEVGAVEEVAVEVEAPKGKM